ncbi:MAG: hypothetical protein ACFFD4_36795 [Candidatus Odinarchaeota archaeon]
MKFRRNIFITLLLETDPLHDGYWRASPPDWKLIKLGKRVKTAKRNRIECNRCHKFFYTKKSLDDHVKDDHVSRECPSCGATLQSWQLLKRHLQVIHYQDFYCDSCRLCFKDQQALSRHVQDNHPFFCSACKRSFKNQQALNQHAIAKHGGDQQQPVFFEIVKSRPVSRAEPRTVIYGPDVDPEEFMEERKRKMRELREMERDR